MGECLAEAVRTSPELPLLNKVLMQCEVVCTCPWGERAAIARSEQRLGLDSETQSKTLVKEVLGSAMMEFPQESFLPTSLSPVG